VKISTESEKFFRNRGGNLKQGEKCIIASGVMDASVNTNNDGITVLKQNANHAIFLAKILSYAPLKDFPTS